jgi:N-acetylmuramoyl-L-alanine amidase
MKLSRREMLVAGLGMLAAGCSQTPTSLVRRPGTPWPGGASVPTQRRAGVAPITVRQPTQRTTVQASPAGVLPRSWWTKAGPIRSKVNPMNGVTRITVHHEGHTPVWFTDQASTRARLEQVRNIHTRDRRWGDIGYHYLIDRAGRVIEGRSIAYQGAHVSKQNPHNVGVMLLGNFEKQSPSRAQFVGLQTTLRQLMLTHRVPVSRVYTHRELGPTVCPGRNLQPRVALLRTSGALA